MSKRIYTTTDRIGYVVVAYNASGIWLVQQDDRTTPKYMLVTKQRATIFKTRRTAEIAARKAAPSKKGYESFVVPVGRREIDRR